MCGNLPPLPGDLPRPANEEQIIAEQWERYEARSSLNTYDMVSSDVAYSDAQMGQAEVMSPQQWFQAMSHVREQIAPILAGGEARGRGGGNNSSISRTKTSSRITCSCCLGIVGFRLC